MSQNKPSPKAKADADFSKRLGAMFGEKNLTPEQQIAADGANEMRWIDYRDLEDNPWQPRTEYDQGDIEEMRDSLNAVGQIQPGVCRPHPDQEKHPGKFQIAVAHRRTRGVAAGGNAGMGRPNAHLYLGKVWMRVASLSDMEMRVLGTRENTDRVDLNPMELAKSYSNIRDLLGAGERKLTWPEVAKFTGLGVRQMRRYADLLDLPDGAQKKIRDGAWNERHGRALLSFDAGDPRQAILMRAIEREGLTGAAAERRVGVVRSAYATQREMDIADTAQRSHETVVAQQSAQTQLENRAQLEAGRSHLTLVVPPVDASPPTLTPKEHPEIRSEFGEQSHQASDSDTAFLIAHAEETPLPPLDPVGELQSLAARLAFLAMDTAATAVITPAFARSMKGGINDCQSALSQLLDALGGEGAE